MRRAGRGAGGGVASGFERMWLPVCGAAREGARVLLAAHVWSGRERWRLCGVWSVTVVWLMFSVRCVVV